MDYDVLVKQEEIDLSGKDLRDDDLGVLIEVLEKSTVLERLDLNNNIISLKDGKFANALSNNLTLRDLNLDENAVDVVGAKHLADALEVNDSLKKLSLSSNGIEKEGTEYLFESLMLNKSLQVLNLTAVGGVQSLATSLVINQTLQTLDLSWWEEIGNEEDQEKFFDALKINRTIKEIDSRQSYMEHEVDKILDNPNRKDISVLQTSLMDWDCLAGQAVIYFCHMNLKDNDLDVINEVLKASYDTKKERFWYCSDEEIYDLKKLYLVGNQITLSDGKFTNALANNECLEFLNLAHNNIGDKGATLLADALKMRMNKSITHSWLKDLQVLDLGDNEIGDQGAEHLAEVLKVNETLEVIRLRNNLVGDVGTSCFADALKVNRTLKEIRLGDNQICDDGARSFAEALMVNVSLQDLDLGGNNIGDKGAHSLATSLVINQTLLRLRLKKNHIGDEGAQKIANSVKFNLTIQKVDLWRNDVSDNVLEKVKAILDKLDMRACAGQLFSLEQLELIIANKGKDITSESKDEQITGLRADIESKQVPPEELAESKDNEVVMKNYEISSEDDKTARKNGVLASKEQLIRSLKTDLANKNKEIFSLKSKLENYQPIIDTVDLTSEECDRVCKRPRQENPAKSALAIQHRSNQKVVQVKQEKEAVVARLEKAREEKEAVEGMLEEAREDLGDANELVGQQSLATDIWQSRFDELVLLFESGQVDRAAISAIRNRSLASGS